MAPQTPRLAGLYCPVGWPPPPPKFTFQVLGSYFWSISSRKTSRPTSRFLTGFQMRPTGRAPVGAHDQPRGVRRIQLRQACIARRTLGVDGLDIDLVAPAPDVEADAAHDGEAVLVLRLHAGEGRIEGPEVVAVIAGR